MLEELKTGSIVVGLKQLRKALKDGIARTVFLARNADPRLVEPVETQCRELGIPCISVKTMAELGQACGIDVGAAAAAIAQVIAAIIWSQRNSLAIPGYNISWVPSDILGKEENHAYF